MPAPPSPSRALSDRFTGKRAYFRTPDAIRFWKYVLAAGAFAAACGWAAVDIFEPSRAAYAHTHGPLASPHAAFDDNCAACHVPHSPSELGVMAIIRTRDRWHDLTCGKCHAGPNDPGFAHHASATDDAKAFHNRCSNCHHDHLGRLNSLIRLSDADCTKCHNDLAKWHDPAKSRAGTPYQNKITGFASDHPQFRSLTINPEKDRKMKFSHAVHMTAGLTVGMKLDQVARLSNPTVAELYRQPGQDPNSQVKLECASCHKLDAGPGSAEYDKLKAALDSFNEPTRLLAPVRSQGAYYLPINYEAHCRACHPLNSNEAVNEVNQPPLKIELINPRFDLPHRRTAKDIRDTLKAGYVKAMLTGTAEKLAPRPGPGGMLEEPFVPPKDEAGFREQADKLVQRAEAVLFSAKAGCAKCHDTEGTGENMKIVPVPDRSAWFRHAKFNHAAHRGATCATCHDGTEQPLAPNVTLVEKEPVQILGLDSCRACHSPTSQTIVLRDASKVNGGGIRHACTDCHNYHPGDAPLQGRGSDFRIPKDRRNLAEWLKGK
jgi:hypothetical protein